MIRFYETCKVILSFNIDLIVPEYSYHIMRVYTFYHQSYISNREVNFLWIIWKYSKRRVFILKLRQPTHPNHLVFSFSNILILSIINFEARSSCLRDRRLRKNLVPIMIQFQSASQLCPKFKIHSSLSAGWVHDNCEIAVT